MCHLLKNKITQYLFVNSIIMLCCSSCVGTKNFESTTDLSPVITHYLQADTSYNPDFLSMGLERQDTSYCINISKPQWVVPSDGLPNDININNSNNNVSITSFENKIYMAFRTGPTHFASKKTSVYIISSTNGKAWTQELYLNFERDVREPYLIHINNKLHFYFFTAGTTINTFQPERVHHYEKVAGSDTWEEKDRVLLEGEVHWSMKKRNNTIYLSSYYGSHYQLNGEAKVSLFFRETKDGSHFYPIADSAMVYMGGVSECAFEFDYDGNLWAVSRLEDGDQTGFGSHVIYADSTAIRNWIFPPIANKEIYMSPKMFNHNNNLYLIARRQRGKRAFGNANKKKSLVRQRLQNWLGYSFSSKTTALYRINKESKTIERVADLPGNGDTAFPSILRLSEHKYLVANYSSPLHKKRDRSWLSGQLGKTGIYLLLIEFSPCIE